jgi:hypothetical protein
VIPTIRTTLLVLIIALPTTSNAQSDPAEAASAVFDEFLVLLTNLEIDSIVDLFSEDALFWGTSSQSLVSDTSGVNAYFSALSGGTPGQNIARKINTSASVISDTLVLVSGTWEVLFNGAEGGTPLRVSMAVALQDGEWKIVQFHNSGLPE